MLMFIVCHKADDEHLQKGGHMAKLYVFCNRDLLFVADKPPVLEREGLWPNEKSNSISYEFDFEDDDIESDNAEHNAIEDVLPLFDISEESLSPAVRSGKEYVVINISTAGTVKVKGPKPKKTFGALELTDDEVDTAEKMLSEAGTRQSPLLRLLEKAVRSTAGKSK